MTTHGKIVIAAIIVICLSVAALLYGLRPAPAPDVKVFDTAKAQIVKKIDTAKNQIVEAKKYVKKSAKKIETLTLTATETEAEYAAIKNTPAPVEEKLAVADAALAACDTRADALADHIADQNTEIAVHEELEVAQTDEIELFSARIDALETENAALRRQLLWARWGAFGAVLGSLGLWALVVL